MQRYSERRVEPMALKNFNSGRMQIQYYDSVEDNHYNVSYSNLKENAVPGDVLDTAEAIASLCKDSKEDVFVHESYQLFEA